MGNNYHFLILLNFVWMDVVAGGRDCPINSLKTRCMQLSATKLIATALLLTLPCVAHPYSIYNY